MWFAFDESSPMAFFAGLWTRWTSVHKVKGDNISGQYGGEAALGAFIGHFERLPLKGTVRRIVRWWCQSSMGRSALTVRTGGSAQHVEPVRKGTRKRTNPPWSARSEKCHKRTPSTQLVFSISLGFQVRSQIACVGPYIQKITKKPLPGSVLSQFLPAPGDAGPKQMWLDTSAVAVGLSLVLIEGNGCSLSGPDPATES